VKALRLTLIVLLLASTAAFLVGVLVERANDDEHPRRRDPRLGFARHPRGRASDRRGTQRHRGHRCGGGGAAHRGRGGRGLPVEVARAGRRFVLTVPSTADVN
jgi:hypothetical protein